MKKEVKKADKKLTFSGLPAKEQKRIIKSAARAANRDQRELIKRYDETFAKVGASCK